MFFAPLRIFGPASVALLLVRPWFGFGQVFALLAGGALLVFARALGHDANEVLLFVIGLTSCLYAVLDVKSDVLDRPEARSDARMLAEATGVPTLVWGVVWIAIALLATVWFVRRAIRPVERQGPERTKGST
ncbi:MAG: M50 family metallopeptidase, partial [Planctomycetota bacterium]